MWTYAEQFLYNGNNRPCYALGPRCPAKTYIQLFSLNPWKISLSFKEIDEHCRVKNMAVACFSATRKRSGDLIMFFVFFC